MKIKEYEGEKNMTFVNELISKLEDIELYNSFQFERPTSNRILKATKWTHWTIDRERNIILVMLGGQGFINSEIPKFGVLVIDGEQVRINFRHGGIGDDIKGLTRWYEIESINIPENIKKIYTTDYVETLIKEAFTQKAYGEDNNDPVLEVKVTFSKRSRGE
jgi:hypothetical protein